MGKKDPMRQREERIKERFSKFYAGLSTSEPIRRRERKKRLFYSYTVVKQF